MLLNLLVAAARMGRAAATTGGGSRAGRGNSIRGFSRAEYGELHGVVFARTLGTFDFLARRHHDALVARLAIIANVFVDRHFRLLRRSGFPQPLDMAFNCISCHLLGLCQGTPIRHEPRQKWNCYLISRFRLRIFPKCSASLCRFPAARVASISVVHRQVNNSESEALRLEFLFLCPIDADLAPHSVRLAL